MPQNVISADNKLIYLFFPYCFSIGDNLHEMPKSVFFENKQNISICHLLKFFKCSGVRIFIVDMVYI